MFGKYQFTEEKKNQIEKKRREREKGGGDRLEQVRMSPLFFELVHIETKMVN